MVDNQGCLGTRSAGMVEGRRTVEVKEGPKWPKGLLRQ